MSLNRPNASLRLLLIEDSGDDTERLLDELRRSGFTPISQRVETAEAMTAALAEGEWHLVIAEYAMPRFSAPAALEVLTHSGREIPFIVVSGTVGEDTAVAMMKAGANDYLLKHQLARLGPVVRRELAEAAGRRARQLAEQQVRLLSQAMRQAPVSVVLTDPQGRIEYVNPRFTDVTGYTFEEVQGRNPRQLKSSLMPDALYDELWATITAGREWHGELINLRKDGSQYWEAATIAPVHDEAGRITHYLAVKQDITDRKTSDQSLREQAALLDQAPDAIYVRDLAERISYWNESAERLFGWLHAEVFGRTLTELHLHELDVETGTGIDLLAAGSWSGERQHLTKHGREIHVFTRLTVVRDAAGRPSRVFAIMTDITEKKRLEARVLQAQRLDSLGALASGLAHDLNNVLSPVMMATQVLLQQLIDPELREMVVAMEASTRRGAGIVRQVLTFARGVDGQRKVVQLRHLIREMVGIATETFPPGITVRHEVPVELRPVLGDATQIHQILMNLCINARDAMPEGGTLLLQAENVAIDESFAAMTPDAKPGPHVCIRVSDTGSGIAPEHAVHIFEPFFTTKAEGKGTGLGLATVLGLTRSHGGFLRFHTKPGRGTTFEVFLPAAAASPDSDLPEGPPTPLRGHGEDILVVDDEPAIRAVTTRVLEQAGYRATCVADGVEAVAAYVRHPAGFATVVTDMVMPGMDGPTLVRTLHRINPALPIIGMTGTENLIRPGLTDGLGVAAMLFKPFTAHQLLGALAEALRAPAAIPSGGASVGPSCATLVAPHL